MICADDHVSGSVRGRTDVQPDPRLILMLQTNQHLCARLAVISSCKPDACVSKEEIHNTVITSQSSTAQTPASVKKRFTTQSSTAQTPASVKKRFTTQSSTAQTPASVKKRFTTQSSTAQTPASVKKRFTTQSSTAQTPASVKKRFTTQSSPHSHLLLRRLRQ